MPSILFVCTANRFRSPLAAAILSQYLSEADEHGDWQVSSAGTWTMYNQPPVPGLEQVADSLGFDVRGHRSTPVDEYLLESYDLILVMEPGQKEALTVEFPALRERVYLLSQVVDRLDYAIPDTFQTEEQIAEVASTLRAMIFKGYRNILTLATYFHNAGRMEPRR